MNTTKENLCDQIYNSINQYLLPGERSISYSHRVINTVVNDFIYFLGEELKKMHPVEIRGFGTFAIIDSKPRHARNFKTGESIRTPAKKRIRFIPSKVLTDPPAIKVKCENEWECPLRIATTIKKNDQPLRICRYHYRCPSRCQDLFQNIPEFAIEAKVLLVTSGELIHGKYYSGNETPPLHVPVVIIYVERLANKEVKLPQYYIITFSKDSITPTFWLGPAEVSFNYQNNRCYVRNEKLDFQFEINEHLFKSEEILRILLHAQLK